MLRDWLLLQRGLRIGVALGLMFGWAAWAQAMPAQVVIIRHAEKYEDPGQIHLSPKGRTRALALAELFQSEPRVLEFGRPAAIIAQSPTGKKPSRRCLETVAPLAFPLMETSAFFSEADVIPPKKIDFLDIYIPTNIFEALAKGTIPAIVVFSVFLGFALNSIDKKETFLNVFSILAQALSRVTQMIIKTAPLGVFALTAVAAGTLTFDQLQRLQVYFVCYIFIALLFTFSILPAIIDCFTPFTYREIINCSKDALILGFATGNNFVILPLISSKSIELLEKTNQEGKKTSTIVDSVLPLAYCFPSLGRILDIFFIVFVAWSVNSPLGIMQHLDLAVAGIMSLFGSPKVGVPFLLDYLKLPGSYFDLYIISDVVTRKFKVLVQAMSFQTVTLILAFLVVNKFTFNFNKISAPYLSTRFS